MNYKQARKALGLTQEDIAWALKTNRHKISRIERGIYEPTPEEKEILNIFIEESKESKPRYKRILSFFTGK